MKKLNAYLISYINESEQVRNVVVVAYYDTEAKAKLTKHFNINLNKKIKIFSCQRLKFTKKNARFYTKEFYEMQEETIENYKGKKDN